MTKRIKRASRFITEICAYLLMVAFLGYGLYSYFTADPDQPHQDWVKAHKFQPNQE